jgi:VanZ family protein
MERPVRLVSIPFMRAYLPVLLWMLVIFVASTNIGSSSNTSRFIGPLLRFFKPDVSDEAIGVAQVIVRKGGHLSEYAILAFLMWRSRRQVLGENFAWDWKEALVIVAVCALYASTDEFHQSFVATRYASPWDALIDTAGAVLGLSFVRTLGPLLMRRKLQRTIDSRPGIQKDKA